MKPVLMHRHRGFLLRVVDNEAYSYRYEWTINGITPATKRLIVHERRRIELQRKRKKWMWPLPQRIYRYDCLNRRLNNRRVRVYDPTSMPTARGRCSAHHYGKDAIDNLLTPPDNWVYFRK